MHCVHVECTGGGEGYAGAGAGEGACVYRGRGGGGGGQAAALAPRAGIASVVVGRTKRARIPPSEHSLSRLREHHIYSWQSSILFPNFNCYQV